MKTFYRYLIAVFFLSVLVLNTTTLEAGNKDRSGEAGASELLINPWARSAGWGGANTANVRGLESMFANVAGIAFTERTEVIFSNTQWLKGSDIDVMNFGFTQAVGENGVMGMSIMSMSFGDIPKRTEDLPEGGIGDFAPSYLTISVGYAKAFSNSIYGGFNLKILSESISDQSAQGIAIDAGIQYVTGARDQIKFGITLRNVGPTMQFSGDGLSIRSILPGQDDKFTVEQRSAEYELPSQLRIGAAYDIDLALGHVLTLAGNFTSNSFSKDQYTFGMEYNLKSYLYLRGGYSYEEGITTDADRTTVYTGPTAGLTVQVPLNEEKGSAFSVDYSYRSTDPFDGTHTIGARINL
ncbi:MAG: PorV/PorQ family protein [Bacteroidales bacterium]|nr:PorV/PorQ family protein [Bacteroidales bacterium]